VRLDFVSDNVAGMAPEALAAVVEANAGLVSAYGTDPYTARAADLVRGLLDVDAEVHFVNSGTAANAIALSALCRPFEAVMAHADSHVLSEEAAAHSFFGQGIGSIPLSGPSGRISVEALSRQLATPDISSSQGAGVLSIANATEYGAVYSTQQIAILTDLARGQGVAVHLDGSRLSNAAAAAFDLKQLRHLGVDIAVIGGAKSGMPATEAMVIFEPSLTRRFRTRLKQAGQLTSKARFGSAAWVGMLESDAWLTRAAHANAMARRLAERLPFDLAHPVEANGVFVHMPQDVQDRLLAAGWRTIRFLDGSVRFMCCWATTPEQIDEVVAAIASVV
jgi:threonine aldolase